MWKAVVVGTTALTLAGSALVYAQQGPDSRDGEPRWRPTAEDAAAFVDARIAGLKAGLKLTSDQEKHWAAYEAAFRDVAKLRRDRMELRRSEQPASDPVERLRRRADAMSTTGSALRRLADAQDPLYRSLDDNQKLRFAALSSGMRHRHGFDDGWRRGDREGSSHDNR